MRLDIVLLLSLLCVLIGLIACSPPSNPTPTIPPTLFPSVTLTIYNPQLVTTFTPDSIPSATILPPAPEFDNIHISPPRCYTLNSQQVTCLGYVDNQSDDVIGDVTLRAIYIDVARQTRGQELFTLEQRTIEAGKVAPYRLQVPQSRLDTNYLQIQLVSAHTIRDTSLPLQLLNMRGTYNLEDNLYIFTADLENPTAFIATDTRLVVTLENDSGDIIGYRVADLPSDISSGESIPIHLPMTPLEATTQIRHRITLEAFPSDTSPTPEG